MFNKNNGGRNGSILLKISGGILLISAPIFLIFPIFKEEINEINYCYAFEKIISRNMFKKNNMPNWIKNTTKYGMEKFVENSRGDFVRESYEESDPGTPPDVYCIIGYYSETFDPGSISDEMVQEFKRVWNEGTNEFWND